jgi:hypothetical protein
MISITLFIQSSLFPPRHRLIKKRINWGEDINGPYRVSFNLSSSLQVVVTDGKSFKIGMNKTQPVSCFCGWVLFFV